MLYRTGNANGPTYFVGDLRFTIVFRRYANSTGQDEPRSQFLQMGFHFAYLLAYCQSLTSPKSVMNSAVLKEMIQHCENMINLAIDTADERTRHLTDHIYHIITFSALTLCRIVHTYESKLRSAGHDIAGMDGLILRLINWFRGIGLSCHVAHILGDILAAQVHKLRPTFQPAAAMAACSSTEEPFLPIDLSFYPDLVGVDLFSINMEMQN